MNRPTRLRSQVVLLLMGATTAYAVLLCGGIIFFSGFFEPPSPPGDPSVGGGVWRIIGLLAVPPFVGWGLWLAARV